MTANIEDISFDKSFESGKLLNIEEAKSILKVLNKWIQNFPIKLENELKRYHVKDEIRAWNVNKEEIEIKGIIEEDIVEIELIKKPKSIENYQEFEIPEEELKRPNEKQKFYKKIIYQYEVKPPILPKTAKKYEESKADNKGQKKKKTKINLPIYKLKNKFYVVIKEKSQIKDAKALAEQYNAQIVTLEKYLKRS